ncbi:MAG: hypothetical protein AB7P40_21430 [Chloroflexota bacterium]
MSPTVVARRVAATPARSAAEAWAVIARLIAPKAGPACDELGHVAGVAMSLIAAEAMRESPIVVLGAGPRIRVYCVYDTASIVGEGVSEEPLATCPTDGEWAMSLPCPKEDLDWVQRELARRSTRVTARDLKDALPAQSQQNATGGRSELGPIDVEAFLRP